MAEGSSARVQFRRAEADVSGLGAGAEGRGPKSTALLEGRFVAGLERVLCPGTGTRGSSLKPEGRNGLPVTAQRGVIGPGTFCLQLCSNGLSCGAPLPHRPPCRAWAIGTDARARWGWLGREHKFMDKQLLLKGRRAGLRSTPLVSPPAGELAPESPFPWKPQGVATGKVFWEIRSHFSNFSRTLVCREAGSGSAASLPALSDGAFSRHSVRQGCFGAGSHPDGAVHLYGQRVSLQPVLLMHEMLCLSL